MPSSGTNKITVIWSAAPGASGYQVYRATSVDGTFSLIKTTTSLSYANTSLSTGTTYYYKVRAYKMVGRTKVYGSYYSATVSAKPMIASVSGALASVTSCTAVKVSWGSVSGRSGYEIWRSTSPGSGFKLIKSTSGTSYKDTKLTPSVTGSPVTYYYKVRAYRTVSRTRVYSDFSAVTNATPRFADVSSATATASSPTTVKISWSSVSGRSGYELWRATSADGEYTLVKSTTSTSYKNTQLAPFVTYYYKVRAYVKAGSVKVYSAFTPVTSETPVLADVTGVRAVRSSTSKIKISWAAVSGKSGYEVWRATSADGEYTLVKSTTSASYSNTGLIAGVTYYYKVRAYVKIGTVKYYSAFSWVVSATP